MSPPSCEDLPPPYVLGDATLLYTKLSAGLDSPPKGSYSAFNDLASISSKPDRGGFAQTSDEVPVHTPRITVADDEAIINGDLSDRASPSRTVLVTHIETYTNRAGELSHIVAWVWLENGRVYYGKHAASGPYHGAGPSPTVLPLACVDGQVIPRMKEGYHKASPEALAVTVSRLAGRDTGPDLCAQNPSSVPSSIELDQHEIDMYERLLDHPHPNVTQYHGVSTYDDEYITGIRLSASKLTFRETILDWPFRRLGGIERGLYAGIAHLHSQGVQHNSLSLSSVRTNDGGDAVLSDLRFATLIGPEEIVDVQSVINGLKGWLRRRHDPDYVAARRLIREARTLRLYAMGRFVYWKVRNVFHSVLDGE